MKTRKLTKLTLITLLLLITTMLFAGGNVQAALQANGGTAATKTVGGWLLPIRQMEETGGTLGLADTINTTDLTSSATSPNNIDIHMQKNTEYGAMAILSASAYGNPDPIPNGGTTTGNKSGVYMYLNKEWVSAGTLSSFTVYKNASKKYKNTHTNSYVEQAGDAIKETKGWHYDGKNSVTASWISSSSASDAAKYAGLLRAYSGSIFSYYGYTGVGSSQTTAYYSKPHPTRAVIVIGTDF